MVTNSFQKPIKIHVLRTESCSITQETTGDLQAICEESQSIISIMESLGIHVYKGIRSSMPGTEVKAKYSNKYSPSIFIEEISMVLGVLCKGFEKETIQLCLIFFPSPKD